MLLVWIHYLFLIYTLMLFARILVSWIPEWRDSRIVQFIAFYTDPYLRFFQNFVPPIGMVDFSPILAFFALQLLEWLITGGVKWLMG